MFLKERWKFCIKVQEKHVSVELCVSRTASRTKAKQSRQSFDEVET